MRCTSLLTYKVCHRFRLTNREMIIFPLILTTFKLSIIFGGSLGRIGNWLEPKFKPLPPWRNFSLPKSLKHSVVLLENLFSLLLSGNKKAQEMFKKICRPWVAPVEFQRSLHHFALTNTLSSVATLQLPTTRSPLRIVDYVRVMEFLRTDTFCPMSRELPQKLNFESKARNDLKIGHKIYD